MPTGIIDYMSLAFTLKWAPGLCLLLLLLFVAVREYSSSSGFPTEGQTYTFAIALATFVIAFYLFVALVWLARKISPFESVWLTTALGYFFGISAALLTVFMPSGSVFNLKTGDLLRLPAMTVLIIPSRIVSSPGERGFRARQVERKRIAEILKTGPEEDIEVLKDKPMKLIDMTPGREEFSLVAVAIKYDKLDIAKHWIERGAKVDEESQVLAAAAAKGDVDVIRYLLQKKAEPVVGRPYSYYALPIWQASRAGKSEVVNLLIEAAKELDASYVDYLFQISVKSCEPKLAHEVLKHGANHKSVNEFVPHFLFSVALYCHGEESAPQLEDFFRLAQKLGVDFKAVDQYGQTIEQYLAKSEPWKLEVFRKLGLGK